MRTSQHHANTLSGVTMRSPGEIVWSMAFVLACLAAMPPAYTVSSGDGGILHIPSAAEVAHCPFSCGDVNISYPFGIGAGCFRQGFEVTCNRTTQPPKLFLGNSATQITDLYDNSVIVPMFFNITVGSGMKIYNMSWKAPTNGITISGENMFFVVGCDFDVTLFDYSRNPVGSCMSRCYGKKVMPTGGPCNGIGCCSISLTNDITGFGAALVRADSIAAHLDPLQQSDPLHSRIMAFMSNGQYYGNDAADLFSSWANVSNVMGAALNIAIMDQPSCKSAPMNKTAYACAIGSNCINASSYRGYNCYCPDNYAQGNTYLLEGCMQDYNTKRKEHCLTSCGSMYIPFPFGLEEGCFASERFRLNCTEGGCQGQGW